MTTWRAVAWAAIFFALVSGGCDYDDVDDEESSEDVDQTESAFAGAGHPDWIPDDRASPPPLAVSWTTPIGNPTLLSSLTLRVRNTSAAVKSYTVRTKSFGLDHRTVTRLIGTFEVSGGQERTHSILLRDAPIKSVSHSSDFTAEITMTHNGEPLVLETPQAFVHFAGAGSTAGTVYSYDAMQASFNGGQLVTNGYALAGSVYNGSTYVDIAALRIQEGLTEPTLGPMYLAQGGGGGSTPPPTTGWFTVCAKWKSKFIDANNGDYATNVGEQTSTAAWAKAELRKVTTLPCPSQNPDACTTIVWSGRLGQDGCVKFNPLTSTNYQLKVFSDIVKPGGNPAVTQWSSLIEYFDSNGVNKGVRSHWRSFTTPAQTSPPMGKDLTLPYQLTNNIAATVSRMFATSGVPAGVYNIHANIGCNDGNPGDPGIPVTDSCAGTSFTYIGPQAPNSDLPGDSMWKNIIAHELGHQVQRKLHGVPNRSYTFYDVLNNEHADPPDLGALTCRCDHVFAANRLHCLQSQERTSDADAEGFAHFMAAKIWNDETGSDCTFNYYKEFREGDPTSTVKQPPYKVSCRNAVQWRDNRCFNSTRGTEYDWMQFFWNLNTVSANKLSMGDIEAIHENACGGPDCTLVFVTWATLRQGALTRFGGDLNNLKYQHFVSTGDAFSTDEDQF